jgi:hypothetical protein
MALSQLQLNVLRTVAIGDVVTVSVLVQYQQEETGAKRTVVRASLSRSLRRLEKSRCLPDAKQSFKHLSRLTVTANPLPSSRPFTARRYQIKYADPR